jgi:hypothetical protein
MVWRHGIAVGADRALKALLLDPLFDAIVAGSTKGLEVTLTPEQHGIAMRRLFMVDCGGDDHSAMLQAEFAKSMLL